VDPLILTLRALQSAANNQHSQAQMTWDAINNTGSQYGAPEIDYDRFAARWESDPILKQLVDRFDGHGLVIKTQEKEQPKQQQGQQKSGEVAKMAKRANSLGK
jgi:hypothetical protein